MIRGSRGVWMRLASLALASLAVVACNDDGGGGDSPNTMAGAGAAGGTGGSAGAGESGMNGASGMGTVGGMTGGGSGAGGMTGGSSGTTGGSSGTTGGSSGESGVGGSGGTTPIEGCPVIVSDADCDESKAPFVFIHGTYGSGDNIGNIAQLFGSNGFCQDRFIAVDYNSLGGNPMAELTQVVDKLIADTGHEQVVLAGHSQGTSHCRTFLNDPANAAKVSHYINYSGTGAVPEAVNVLSVSSEMDIGNTPLHASGADEMVTYTTADHFTLAASKEAFVDTWKYLYGSDPMYTDVQCGDEMVTLAGIAETFAENIRITAGEIRVHELGDDPRERGEPVLVISSANNGVIPPFQLKRDVAYEFESLDGDGVLIGHMYFAPFKRSNYLLRFLAPSDNPLVSILSTDNIDRNAAHVGMVFRYTGGAFRKDLGHSLKINGNEVLSDENAGPATTTVGLFLYDDDLNMMTSLGAPFTAPFLVGSDVFVAAEPAAMMEIDWNGYVMHVPNMPSDKGLVSIMLP